MVKEQKLGKTETSMLGHTRMGKGMVKEYLLILMEHTTENTVMGIKLDKERTPGLMETSM